MSAREIMKPTTSFLGILERHGKALPPLAPINHSDKLHEQAHLAASLIDRAMDERRTDAKREQSFRGAIRCLAAAHEQFKKGGR